MAEEESLSQDLSSGVREASGQPAPGYPVRPECTDPSADRCEEGEEFHIFPLRLREALVWAADGRTAVDCLYAAGELLAEEV